MTSRNATRRGSRGVGARVPWAVLFGLVLTTWLAAGCSGRADLGGTSDRDAGSAGASAGTTGSGTGGGSSGGSGASAGASAGRAPSGGTAGVGGMASGDATIDAGTTGDASGSGGGSSGGASGSGASGGTPSNGGATGGSGSSAGGATAGGGPSSGGASPDAGPPSGGTNGAGGALGATCSNGVKDGDETDRDCGGSCGPCGLGQACGYSWDCSATAAGCDTSLGGCACDEVSHVCVASHCVDRRRDSTESDVDCGGQCAGCGPGKVCYHDADCSTNVSGCDQCACDFFTSTCVYDHCVDNRLDADETDLDCGGAKCNRCALGASCKADSDCASGACDTISRTCTYYCHDHHLDNDESDVDCGGGSCNACMVGQKCLSNFDCQGGHLCNASKVCQ